MLNGEGDIVLVKGRKKNNKLKKETLIFSWKFNKPVLQNLQDKSKAINPSKVFETKTVVNSSCPFDDN